MKTLTEKAIELFDKLLELPDDEFNAYFDNIEVSEEDIKRFEDLEKFINKADKKDNA